MGALADRKTWAKRVAAWRGSGLTCKEFAEREGLGPWRTLRYWAWRLDRERASKSELVKVVRKPSPIVVEPRAAKVTELEVRVGESRVAVRIELAPEDVAPIFNTIAAALGAALASKSSP